MKSRNDITTLRAPPELERLPRHMSAPSPTQPPPRRRGFRATLIRVLAVQAVAIALLVLLQYCYHVI
jgi:hypothetical protein